MAKLGTHCVHENYYGGLYDVEHCHLVRPPNYLPQSYVSWQYGGRQAEDQAETVAMLLVFWDCTSVLAMSPAFLQQGSVVQEEFVLLVASTTLL